MSVGAGCEERPWGVSEPAPDFRGYPLDSPFRGVWRLLQAVIERVEAQEQAELIARTYELMCWDSLRLPPSGQAGRLSVITGSGVPFEFSFTTADQPGTVRILSEAAPASLPLPERVARTVDCLTELVALHKLSGDRRTIEEHLNVLLPPNLHAFDSSWYNGALWLSARFASRKAAALRVYVNQQWNNNAFRFLNAHKFFRFVGQEHNAERLLGLFDSTDGWAEIAGVSFDITDAGVAGIKVYFGTVGATTERIAGLLRRLGLSRDAGQAATFLDKMKLVEKGFAGPSLLLSVSFPSADNVPPSLKMDVTTRAVFACDRDVYEATEDVLHAFRMHALGYRACEDLFFPDGFPTGHVQTLQYVGLALSGHGAPRLNIYLAPPVQDSDNSTATRAVSRRRALTGEPAVGQTLQAAADAVRYLLKMQSLDGGWWDFTVSVGSSGPWMTAVVGEILNEVPAHLRTPALENALAAAVEYLAAARLPGGGWGYNEALPADCDSTAHSIIFLHSLKAEIDEAALACLRRFQRDDGAFLTYLDAPPNHSWGTLHYDVHGPAVRALARLLGREHPSVRKGISKILMGLDSRVVWPAFWWKPQIYGAYVNLLCLREVGELEAVAGLNDGEFRGALSEETNSQETELSKAFSGMVALMLQSDPSRQPLKGLWRSLLDSQLPDGSWPASRALRVTSAACFEPWSQPDEAVSGTLYRDARRIFTTALTLKFLAGIIRGEGRT